MRDVHEIRSLLDELEQHSADRLEDQELDFKEWDVQSMNKAIRIQYLLRHLEIDTTTATQITQQTEADARETMSQMETDFDFLERGGTSRGTYWILRHDLHRRLSIPGHPERGHRIDWEAAKTRVLSVLMERAKRSEIGLSNEEIRQITHYDRNQSRRLMLELMKENPAVKKDGERRWARYTYSM